MLRDNNWIAVILIALGGSSVSYIRKHSSERFNVRKFADGMIVAAFCGVVTSCICRGFHVDPMLSSAAVAIAGYCGGSLLDATEQGIISVIEKGLARILGIDRHD